MDNLIDKLAREEIKNREIQPHKSVWDQLEAQLDLEQVTKKNGKNRNNFRFTGLLFLVIMSSLAWFILKNSKSENELTPQNIAEPMTESLPAVNNVDQIPENSIPAPLQKSKPVISIKNDFQYSPILEIKELQNKTPQSKIIEKSIEPKAQPMASTTKTDENQINDEKPSQEVIIVQNTTSPRFNATKLLEEANADLSKHTSKYNIDPALLLKSAEKDSRDQFFNKVVKTLAETSTNVYAMVNNRNVEP